MNKMCLTCNSYGDACEGVQEDFWSGCILRDSPPEHVREYNAKMALYWNHGRAEKVAAQIKARDTWDDALNRELCKLAGLESEYDGASGETFEAIVFKAAELLSVEIT